MARVSAPVKVLIEVISVLRLRMNLTPKENQCLHGKVVSNVFIIHKIRCEREDTFSDSTVCCRVQGL